MKLQIALVVFGLACSALAVPAKVEQDVYRALEVADTTTIIVTFKKSDTPAALKRFESLRLSSRVARLNTMHALLKDHADTVQADVMSMLVKVGATKNFRVEQSWATAELIIYGVDLETVELLRSHPDVETLVAEQWFPLDDVMEEFSTLDNNTIQNEWGILNTQAPEAWAAGFNGGGVLAGIIDTGCRHTHESLNPTYAGTAQGSPQYVWFDPGNVGSTVPVDPNGHGTHVIGSISGIHGLGVAPGSRWMTCRGCAGAACSNAHLLSCGNFIACPTNTAGTAPDCSRAPNLVNNSWGGGSNNAWYDGIIAAWRAVHIMPIFAAGNSGPGCNTANSPGDRIGAIGVGSITIANASSGFSSNGPTVGDGRQKPEVSAPGTSVVSATHLADVGTRTLSGTSMAAPHAAGVFAVLLSQRPTLTVDQALAIVRATAIQVPPQGRTCAGVPDSARPNHHHGSGRVSALAVLSG